jgi:16S rRNA processing protein RimM
VTDVAVGAILKAHGLTGEVAVEVRTDTPQARFRPGAVLQLDKGHEELTVATARWHQGRLLIGFVEVTDRTAAEALAGSELTIEVDPDETTGDPEEFYDHQLVGLRAESVSGREVGSVQDVLHGPGQDSLLLDTPAGERIVPFVAALVPVVDVDAGRIVVADLAGLLDDRAEEA